VATIPISASKSLLNVGIFQLPPLHRMIASIVARRQPRDCL